MTKSIEGFEGIYEINDKLEVRRLGKNKKGNPIKHVIINGYPMIRFYKDKKLKKHLLHRLVAKAFIPNPLNKAQVNHINGIKTDYRIENLEWSSYEENQIHACETGLKKGTNFYFENTLVRNIKNIIIL